MPEKIIIMALVLLVSAVSTINETVSALLRNKLEEALINSTDSLFVLQKAFFSPAKHESNILQLSVCITVGKVEFPANGPDECQVLTCQQANSHNDSESECNNTLGCFNYTLHSNEGGISKISDILGLEGYATLQILDPILYVWMGLLSSTNDKWNDYLLSLNPLSEAEHRIDLHISDLVYIPSDDDVCNALSILLVWAKAFARSNGFPGEKYYEDRSIVNFIPIESRSDYYDNYSFEFCNYFCKTSAENGNLFDSHVNLNLLIGIIVVANVLISMLFLRNIPKISSWIQELRQGKYGKIIFSHGPGSRYMILNYMRPLLLSNILFVPLMIDILFLSLAVSDTFGINNTLSRINKITIVIKFLIVILLPLVEFFYLCACKYYYKGSHDHNIRVVNLFFIIYFAHRLLIGICVSVMFFIISPAQTLGIIALLFFAILTAFILYTRLHKGFIESYINVTAFVFVCMVIVFFIALVDNGLQSSGMGGFILSIIPPIIAGIIGLYLNREAIDNFFKTSSDQSLTKHPAQGQNDGGESVTRQ